MAETGLGQCCVTVSYTSKYGVIAKLVKLIKVVVFN